MINRSFKHVTKKVCYDNFNGVSRTFDVSRKFQRIFKQVSRGFKGNVMEVSMVFHRIFKVVSRVF